MCRPLATTYHMAADLAGAAALAINAGVDMAMLPFNADQWQTAVQQDVANHSVSVSRINQAVSRILTLKFQLGLFDHPTVDASKADAAVEAGRDVTLKAAQESMTLLRNQNNALPLSPSSKLVVTGPSADSMTNQLGGWSVSWQGVFGAGHVCCMGPADQIPPGTTVLKGLQAAGPERDLRGRPGHRGERRQVGGRRRGRGGREGLRRGPRATTPPRSCHLTSRR